MVLNIFSHGLSHHELFTKISNMLQLHTLLLIQDGVYFGLHLKENINIYAIQQDVISRGLINSYPDNIKLIDYNEFVELVLNHDKSITY